MVQDPSDACAEQRQAAEQNQVARFGVHFRSRLERGSTLLPLLARDDGLEPKYAIPRRRDGRPSFWERPNPALSDRRSSRRAVVTSLVGQRRLPLSMVGKKSLH